MHIDQIFKRFNTLGREGLIYQLNAGASQADVRRAELRLGVQFPDQVAAFWRAIDGLEVRAPPLKLLPLSDFDFDGESIIFGICNDSIRLALDTKIKNEAGQWSIINADTGFQITHTMTSFWSSHLWTWIVKRRPIWFDAHPSVGK